jgi:hypothetical protein
MIAAGLLTDDLGNKLTDDSKINFAKPIEAAVEDLVGAIKDLVDTMKKGVQFPVYEKYVPDKNRPPKSGDEGSTGGAATGGLVGFNKVIPFRLGGPVFRPIGTDTVPAMLTPGEIVLNAAQQRNVAGSISGGSRDLDAKLDRIASALERLPMAAGGEGDTHVYIDGQEQTARVLRAVRRDTATGRLRPRAPSGRSY